MLALARVDSVQVAPVAMDVTALAEEVTRAWWAEARASGIDLGFESEAQPLVLLAHPVLLKEALSCLLYTSRCV